MEELFKVHAGCEKNNHTALDHAMRKFPKMFIHIRQKDKIKTIEETIMDAERLEKENGGLF